MICGSAAGVRVTPGRNDWRGSHPVPARATFDGTAGRRSLPFNKARAGQRRIIGPIYLSPDTDCWRGVRCYRSWGAWLVEQLADARRKKLTEVILGSEQGHALLGAADPVVWVTAEEWA
jgi:hypothetical protein